MSILSYFKSDVHKVSDRHLDLTAASGNTIQLKVGRTVPQQGSINDHDVNTRVTLLNQPLLTQVTLREQAYLNQPEESYLVAEMLLSRVAMNLEIEVESDWLPIQDLLFMQAQVNDPELSRDTFNEILYNMRMDFGAESGIDTKVPNLFTQLIGADRDKFDSFVETFIAAGASDDFARRENRPRTMTEAYRHADGLPVNWFEVSKTNRALNSRNQGFISFVDAVVGTYERQQEQINWIMDQEGKMSNLSGAKLKALQDMIATKKRLVTQASGNWAGSAQRQNRLADGTLESAEQYDLVKATCGRFEVVIDGDPVAVDLWTRRSGTTAADGSSPSTQDTDPEFDRS